MRLLNWIRRLHKGDLVTALRAEDWNKIANVLEGIEGADGIEIRKTTSGRNWEIGLEDRNPEGGPEPTTIGDGKLTIKTQPYGGSAQTAGEFTANQSGDSEITIQFPQPVQPSDATITIKLKDSDGGEVSSGTFTLNQSSGKTIILSLPSSVFPTVSSNNNKVVYSVYYDNDSHKLMGVYGKVQISNSGVLSIVPMTGAGSEFEITQAVPENY